MFGSPRPAAKTTLSGFVLSPPFLTTINVGGNEVSQNKKRPQSEAYIASDIPGRMRIKLRAEGRQPVFMNGLKEKMSLQEGMNRVRSNSTTGSLTFDYDRDKLTRDSILDFLEDLDVVASEITPALSDEAPEVGRDEGAPLTFLQAVDDLDKRMRRITGVDINLKLALPLLFASMGLWAMGKHGLRITMIPGWVFLWMAFDMFVRLHPHGR
jgi:hypothetical protein